MSSQHALLRTHQGRLADAEPALRQHLHDHPTDPAAHMNLGVFLAEHSRLDDALPLLRRAAELAPDSPVAHRNLGTALSAARRPPPA